MQDFPSWAHRAEQATREGAVKVMEGASEKVPASKAVEEAERDGWRREDRRRQRAGSGEVMIQVGSIHVDDWL